MAMSASKAQGWRGLAGEVSRRIQVPTHPLQQSLLAFLLWLTVKAKISKYRDNYAVLQLINEARSQPVTSFRLIKCSHVRVI